MPTRSGIVRVAQFTAGGAVTPDAPTVTVGLTINGAAVGSIIETLSITGGVNEQPTTCVFTCYNQPVRVGATVILTAGDRRLFHGKVTSVTKTFAELAEHVMWAVSCVGRAWLLKRRVVTATYRNLSATTIVRALAALVPGFTTTHVAEGLPVIPVLRFDNSTVDAAVTETMRRIGGHWRLDYFDDVHAAVIEAGADDPQALGPGSPIEALAWTEDLAQTANRIIIDGAGSQVSAPLDPPFRHEVAGRVYVDDAAPFALSGLALAAGNGRVFQYSGKGVQTDVVGTGGVFGYQAPAHGGALTPGQVYFYTLTITTPFGESTARAGVTITLPDDATAVEFGQVRNLETQGITAVNLYRAWSEGGVTTAPHYVGSLGLPPGPAGPSDDGTQPAIVQYRDDMSDAQAIGGRALPTDDQSAPPPRPYLSSVVEIGADGSTYAPAPPLVAGDPLAIRVVLNDVAAQAALATLLQEQPYGFNATAFAPTAFWANSITVVDDGVIEEAVRDSTLTAADAVAYGQAWLATHAPIRQSVRYRTTDPDTHPGAISSVHYPPPTDITGDFTLQTVTISRLYKNMAPLYDATASSERVSFDDLLARLARPQATR